MSSFCNPGALRPPVYDVRHRQQSAHPWKQWRALLLLRGHMLDGHVLVLNRVFQAVQITSVRRALILFYKGHVRAVDSEYRTYDFENWMDIPVQPDDHYVATPHRK